ncbi:glycoside hydrolase family 95 protein [Chryseosolibacter indicus]|uniref:Glycoside hydrolase N-terminal domain-containing protein n=1 Tax=Chryseosolibacter indicus TaxID=2782351 RepID=A0ABS5VU23_9BACT|nr:glycoside hydrolase family 95 protein [Chryseosolibacter indicus]MBT1704925.1 glycoside hydrolase N-terminal domain-containing protein [Chryseosolibacter indicus]
MKIVVRLFSLLLTFIVWHHAGYGQNHLKLWYQQPAKTWNEALPIGNGRLAAMVFSNPQTETLQLNEETVWAGEPGNNIPSTGFAESLPEIQRLIFADEYEQAHKLAMQKIPRSPAKDNNYGMPYQPVGNVLIDFPTHQHVTDYHRELDISKAIQSTTYTANGVTYTREVFTSFTDQVVVVRLTASKKQSITCSISVECPHREVSIEVGNKTIGLSGTSGSKDNKKGKVKFVTQVQPVLEGGTLTSSDTALHINRATAITVFISIGTNFKSYNDLSENPLEKATKYLNDAKQKPYKVLKDSHIEYYRKFFNRVSLDLGTTAAANKPTDVRLSEFHAGNDPHFVTLIFQFGRYLLISSSQPGTQPANLQGKWNDKIAPPWDSKYTVNINTEMNYWPAEVTNLPEMHQSLFNMLHELEITGKESASKLYKARGWNLHHNTDLWRITGPVDGAFYGLWPMGGAWLSQHIWQHYLYSGDLRFLETHYSILKGAALFYHDILVEEPTNKWLMVVPSMSPENHHRPDISIAAGTTMDNQLVFDVFSNFIEASSLLNRDFELRDSVKIDCNRLPPMQIGKHSQLQEWLKDWDDPNDKHRHVSHLYGLYPSNQISPYRNYILFQAARNSLEYRGDQSTGWSMGWKVNLWARLLDGDRAYKLIRDQLTPALENTNNAGGTYPNLLDAHPPFQIDGNFGVTSGIAEMLVQSHDGAVHLLPALPAAWKSGSIAGLRTRGGFTIDLSWKDSKIKSIRVTSSLGGNFRIRSHSSLTDKRLKKSIGDNVNPFFKSPEIKTPLVSAAAKFNSISSLKAIYEYDFQTKPNETYTFDFGN